MPVTAEQLRNAPIGSLCGHPAGRLQNGKLPGIPQAAGFVELRANPTGPSSHPNLPTCKTIDIGDLDGDGVDEAVANGRLLGGVASTSTRRRSCGAPDRA